MSPSPRVDPALEGFDADRPLAEAAPPPARWFTDPELHTLERERVFSRSWQPWARLDELREPGAYVAATELGQPVTVLRDGAGALRALRNVCRHQGAEVARGRGTTQRFACPYHGWTYDLTGRLVSAPRCPEALAEPRPTLPTLPVEAFGPFARVALSKDAPEPGDAARSLATRLAERDFRFVARRRYAVACNWKVFVDNYLDGGYHVPALHPGLAAQLDTTSYRTEFEGEVAIQRVEPSGDAPRVAGGALYAWLHPNWMLNHYGPFLDTNWVLPLAPDRCEVVFDWFVEAHLAGDRDLVSRSLAASDAVQREDVEVCESVQRGLASGALERGRYAGAVEGARHHFHRLLARDLARA